MIKINVVIHYFFYRIIVYTIGMFDKKEINNIREEFCIFFRINTF